MKKRWFFVPLIVMLVVSLCACGPVALSNTIDASDGSVSIDTPDDWSHDGEDLDNYIVLSIADTENGFANISYYALAEGYTVDSTLEYLEDYYGENIIGDIEETEIDDRDAVYFEYSMVDTGEDGSEYNYHGYEYFIAFSGDVVEVDIFYSQGKLEGKLFTPSTEQLSLLRSIAETVRVKE